MNTRIFKPIVATLLMITLVTQVTLFAFPQTTRAEGGVPTDDFVVQIKEALIYAKAVISTASVYATYINQYYLQPLAFVMSVGLLKAMTAGVIAFAIGKSNGTGQPQFAQDLQGTLQKVGDIKAQAFFLQFGRNSNSPFAGAITSSLRTQYLQNTSLSGFWAAQKCTLGLSSSNVNAFLAGRWSQGGTKAWLALTTQPQNNPYTLYQTSKSQLASVVLAAQSTRDKVLSWGQGFMSWCGTTDSNASAGSAGSSGEAGSTGSAGGSAGINPGDSCQNADGTAGTIKTPGSVIASSLSKVLGSAQDKLVQIGSMAKEVQGVMGDIANILQTVNVAKSILGGVGSGGLAGFGSGGSNSGLNTYNRSDFLNVTNDTVYKGSGVAIQADVASTSSKRVNDYEAAWNTIGGSAQSASAALTTLITFCLSADASTTQATQTIQQAQTAMTTEVTPIFARVSTASTTIATARASIAKVMSEKDVQTDAGQAAYFNDLQLLQTLAPTDNDVLTSQQDATGGGALASPAGSLTVSGRTLVGQMMVISANAVTLKQACIPVPNQFDQSGQIGG